MAFDFLGSVLGRKKPEQPAPAKPQTKEIRAGDALSWLESQVSGGLEAERKRFSSISGDLLRLLKDLQRITESIRKRGFEEGDRTYAAINMIKDTWAKKAAMGLSSYWREGWEDKTAQGKVDFPAFREHYHGTVRLMNEITMIPKQKIVLQRYFEDESRQMAAVLKSIGAAMEQMKSSIEAAGAMKSTDKIKAMLDNFAKLEKEEKALKSGVSEKSSGIISKKRDIEALEKKLKMIDEKAEWKEMVELDRKMKDSLERKDDIENEIAERLGSMKRVFKLFAHEARDLKKDEKRILEDMSHSPVKTFLSEDPQSIENILGKMKADIENGSFRLSDKDSGKTHRLDEMLEKGWAPGIRTEHERTLADSDDAKRKRDEIKVVVEKRETERMLEKAEVEAGMLRRDRSELEKRLEERERITKEKKEEISDTIKKDFGKEVRII